MNSLRERQKERKRERESAKEREREREEIEGITESNPKNIKKKNVGKV